jgi:hypothetical protein
MKAIPFSPLDGDGSGADISIPPLWNRQAQLGPLFPADNSVAGEAMQPSQVSNATL